MEIYQGNRGRRRERTSPGEVDRRIDLLGPRLRESEGGEWSGGGGRSARRER